MSTNIIVKLSNIISTDEIGIKISFTNTIATVKLRDKILIIVFDESLNGKSMNPSQTHMAFL